MQFLRDFRWYCVTLATSRAKHSNKPLRENAIDCRREEIVLNSHVEKTRDRARRIVGVHGRENNVAGQSSLDCYLCSLAITNLTDHDYIRVLAQKRTQGMREGQSDLRFDLD